MNQRLAGACLQQVDRLYHISERGCVTLEFLSDLSSPFCIDRCAGVGAVGCFKRSFVVTFCWTAMIICLRNLHAYLGSVPQTVKSDLEVRTR